MKKTLSTILFVLFVVLSGFSQQVEIDWVEVKAKITKIDKYRVGRKVHEKATVVFKTKEKAKEVSTVVELDRIPFLGSFKSAGDEITVSYDKKNPFVVKTTINAFINKYGLYLLVFAGICIMGFYYRKMFKKSKAGKLNQ